MEKQKQKKKKVRPPRTKVHSPLARGRRVELKKKLTKLELCKQKASLSPPPSVGGKKDKSKKFRKYKRMDWDRFEGLMLSDALLKFYNELMPLERTDFCNYYLRGLQHFKPLLQRDPYVGKIDQAELDAMPRSVVSALANSQSESQTKKIIKRYRRGLSIADRKS